MIRNESVQGLLEALAAGTATPGGGSATALLGAMAAALVGMVCRLTQGRQSSAGVEAEIGAVLARSEHARARLAELIEQDVEAYAAVMRAYEMPRGTDEERAARGRAIQSGLVAATRTPLECARCCGEVMELARYVAREGNRNAVGEAAVAMLTAQAALRSSALNVYINTRSIRDAHFVATTLADLEQIMRGNASGDEGIEELVRRRLQ